jgi:signal transduction protein with GAF and PtsI domain
MDLLQQLSSARDLDEALRLIIAHFKADSGTIHMMEDGVLKLRASHGIPEVVLNMVRSVPIGKGMAGLAAQRRECVTVCNLQTDSSGDVRPGAKKTGMEGAIAVPILDRSGGVVGVLGIANRNERTFSDAEQKLLVECGKALAGRV